MARSSVFRATVDFVFLSQVLLGSVPFCYVGPDVGCVVQEDVIY